MSFRFLGIFLLCFALCSAEPVCSRFHYEEQTLRKMIMVEMLVDGLKAEIAETKRTVTNALDGIRSDHEKLKQKFDDFQSSMDKDSDGATNEVLFRTRNVKNTSPSSGEVIIFQTVLTNIGSAYDHQSGMFTAPVAGLYMFTLQLCIANEQYIYFEIVVDGEPILRSFGVDDFDKYNTGDSFSTAAILEAGSKVWVKKFGGTKKCICTVTDHWNMFHGFLVRQN